MPLVAVIGGGISGLAAARDLRRAGLDVAVIEGSDRWGGKIDSALVDGVRVDTGAESMLARRPEPVALINALGLADRLVHPTPAVPELLAAGALHPLPQSVSGIPTDLDQLSRLLTPFGLARARREPAAGPLTADVAIGRLVDERLGREVTDRLVEPLLGGIYAGRARTLSFAAVSPGLFQRLGGGGSLVEQARAVAEEAPAGPVFAGLKGGVAVLIDALVDDLERVEVDLEPGVPAARVQAVDGGFDVILGSGASARRVDAVVVAAPWRAASRLLAEWRELESALSAVPYASTAIVTMVVRGLRATTSGLLAAPGELPTVKALTYSSTKWAWLAAEATSRWGSDVTVVRASVGRLGEERLLQLPDRQLLARTFGEAESLPDWQHTQLIFGHVRRWGGALPQYLVGHRERVAAMLDRVARIKGLAICGAAIDGLGIAACLGSASAAVAKIIADLGAATSSTHDHPEEGSR
jgi:protoporphyrinogen/coproporphyrinogen III oxidase